MSDQCGWTPVDWYKEADSLCKCGQQDECSDLRSKEQKYGGKGRLPQDFLGGSQNSLVRSKDLWQEPPLQ
ncbi:hypothetical protein SERLA73DRAFT_80245 [Serpula lacrymans var. lacrymans S7.3]|uniref:Uncharacterized protein n=1 Tax=Serpula lacrymans var. lacrymans (strain S7.3) TaxID=936435 RepID=F8QJ68_SERL3|nr:hypothetical protein SERLA73DRAFT_80245 [Serpula lacrymans var. lacrymans S7.3]